MILAVGNTVQQNTHCHQVSCSMFEHKGDVAPATKWQELDSSTKVYIWLCFPCGWLVALIYFFQCLENLCWGSLRQKNKHFFGWKSTIGWDSLGGVPNWIPRSPSFNTVISRGRFGRSHDEVPETCKKPKGGDGGRSHDGNIPNFRIIIYIHFQIRPLFQQHHPDPSATP